MIELDHAELLLFLHCLGHGVYLSLTSFLKFYNFGDSKGCVDQGEIFQKGSSKCRFIFDIKPSAIDSGHLRANIEKTIHLLKLNLLKSFPV